jgi:uncharacterized protein YbaP (TraB family)
MIRPRPWLRWILWAALPFLWPAAASAEPTPGTDCPPQAVAPTPEQVQAGLRAAQDRGFLWRLEKDGHRSYLYGTVHVAKPAWMYPGPKVLQALRQSETVALELDLLDPDVQHRMQQGMAAQRDLVLPAEMAARLQRQMRAECVAPENLAGLGPEMQLATLSLLIARGDGLDPAYGIDLFIDSFARGAGKRVVSLETPELQLQVLQSADAAQAIESVASGLADLESGSARPQLVRMAGVWAESDLAELSRYRRWCDCVKTSADRAALKRLLDDRNPGLAAAIDALHAKGPVFAAVGSLHMIGPRGLPALLAQRGYKVDRVAYSP